LLLLAGRAGQAFQAYEESLQLLGNFTLQQLQLLQHNQPASPPLPAVTPPTALARSYGLIGESTAMQRVYQLIGKVLHNPVTVLRTGETGTGKERVARAIHDYGSRRSENFLVQNCAALPEHLLESELFGYRRGAFTGADRDYAGLIASAQRRRVFLAAIGSTPRRHQ